ncbi:MAG: RdgB/HAM1 family non-canonical purine NTP pyrophosphatase [Chloroflexi bacterium]|nr:RdgB/HAM1 family non-canonical purine NTP pyrophosphatase [Chloroflexota bacterium]
MPDWLRPSSEGLRAQQRPRPPGGPSVSQPRVLLATRNPAKDRELRGLLGEAPVELVTLDQVGVREEVEEKGATLEENAALKAQTYARLSGLWALADDSGLEVDALGGEPGAHSKRYAGDGASDADRIRYLLKRLEGVLPAQRTARFRSIIAIASPDGHTLFAKGEVSGTITEGPRGNGGFGYDPVFYLPQQGRTMAELSLAEKNAISHRGRAAAAASKLLLGLAAELDPQ